MTDDTVLGAALNGLAGVRHNHSDATRLVPKEAGLYAFYGDARAWSELELDLALEDQPFYVGWTQHRSTP